jgi:hypothetical protein
MSAADNGDGADAAWSRIASRTSSSMFFSAPDSGCCLIDPRPFVRGEVPLP